MVIEFILNHVDQIFNNGTPASLENNGNGFSWHTPHQAILLLCLTHGAQEEVRVGLLLALSVGCVRVG